LNKRDCFFIHNGIAYNYYNNFFKLLTPALLNLKSIFVPINKHGGQAKHAARLIEDAYASENQIITFPAGMCSRKINGKIQDLEWKKSFIQKAVEYKRDVVPVYFEGRNSNFFYRFTEVNPKRLVFARKHLIRQIYHLVVHLNTQSLSNIGKPVKEI
jgi:hypothetical protein